MATKNEAVLEAIRNADNWMGHAVVVKADDGSYEAHPGTNMTDITFSGSKNVVFTVEHAIDVVGDDQAQYSDEDLLAYIEKNVANAIE